MVILCSFLSGGLMTMSLQSAIHGQHQESAISFIIGATNLVLAAIGDNP